jgi:hypothetical protein
MAEIEVAVHRQHGDHDMAAQQALFRIAQVDLADIVVTPAISDLTRNPVGSPFWSVIASPLSPTRWAQAAKPGCAATITPLVLAQPLKASASMIPRSDRIGSSICREIEEYNPI